ncbi:hypothetical protein [Tenacibaculum sp. 190524A05c]|uniref:hypothetical protein n=1 Tax=Tenacibaculum platacis TaxID=3137852 RepID=UPI0031FB8310
MNKKIQFFSYLLISFLSISLVSAQQLAEKTSTKKKPVLFKTYNIDNSFNLNQFVFSFLEKEGGFNRCELKKLKEQSTTFNTVDNEDKRALAKRVGSSTRGVTRIYLDNSEILGIGINRLYLLDNMRLKEFSLISVSNPSYDRQIYLFTKSEK